MQCQVTQHRKKQENKNTFQEKTVNENEPVMIQALELMDKDFIGTIIAKLKHVKENISIMTKKIRGLCQEICMIKKKKLNKYCRTISIPDW